MITLQKKTYLNFEIFEFISKNELKSVYQTLHGMYIFFSNLRLLKNNFEKILFERINIFYDEKLSHKAR